MNPFKLLLVSILCLSFNLSFADRGDVSGGGDSVELEVERTLEEFATILIENRADLNAKFDIDAFEIATLAKKTTVINVKADDLKNIEYGENFFKMKRNGFNRTVYAKNYRLPEKAIFINNQLWQTITDDIEKQYILFHELLGVTNVEVNAYKEGNKIFKEVLKIQNESKKTYKRVVKKIGNLFKSKDILRVEQSYLASREEEILRRSKFEGAMFLFEKRFQKLDEESEALDQELEELERRIGRVDICVGRLNVEQLMYYGQFQFGEYTTESIVVNKIVEDCIESND